MLVHATRPRGKGIAVTLGTYVGRLHRPVRLMEARLTVEAVIPRGAVWRTGALP